MAVAVYGGGIGLAMLAKATQVTLHAMTLRTSESASITPLIKCFQKQSAFEFIVKWDGESDDFDVVEVGEGGSLMCKVIIDKPSNSPHGVVATSRLVDGASSTLATVVARKIAVTGQEVTIVRGGMEIFGFMQADGEHYHLLHRTGKRLLTLGGDAATCNVSLVGPTGLQVGFVQREGNICKGQVCGRDVDVGLVIASLTATRFHRKLVSEGVISVPQALPPQHKVTMLQRFRGSTLSRRLIPVWLAAYNGCGMATLCPFLPSQLLGPAIGSCILAASAAIRAAVMSPGTIPDGPGSVWKIGEDSVEEKRQGLTSEKKRFGDARFCKWTNLYKPDRAHYCRECHCCVLHMESYSNDLNNCIGFCNHRFFCQFLFWSAATHALMLGSLPQAWNAVVDPNRHAFSRAWTFAACIGAVLDPIRIVGYLCLEAWLLKKNMTKIEYFEKSRRPNFETEGKTHKLATWGMNPFVWLLPIAPPPAAQGVLK